MAGNSEISTEAFGAYLDHALVMNEHELALREQLVPELPDTIVDSHTHFVPAGACDPQEIPPSILGHMMSTFASFTFEQSRDLDEMFFPGKQLSKARFSHVFPNIDKREVNEAVLETAAQGDYPVLFGVSDTPEDVDYTVAQLESGGYRGLKMYYLASEPPKYNVYEYFPQPVLQAAERAGTPIILHLPHSLYRSEAEVFRVAEDYPDLKVILAHVGVANVPKPEIDSILAGFATLPNVYADTALVDSDEIVHKALQHLGPERVLYGSDEPLNLMRTQTYFNPKLQAPRVLTDYPYHWARADEQAEFRHLAEGPFVHNHWAQVRALVGGIALVSGNPEERQHNSELVFRENARELFAA
jgi:predicted TIM-barrel fold metal-dependent hydrolase